MENIGAFFDIDGTIFRGSLLNSNFQKLVRHEIIDERIWHDQVKEPYLSWKNRRSDYDSYLHILSKLYLENLIGVDKRYLSFLARQTIEDQYDSVYRYSRERLRWHKENGHKIFFISGSPDFLVKEMAKKYEVTDYRGTDYLADENNKLTGKINRMWNSESKYIVVNEFVHQYNIDLSKSYAYGDTNGDCSMLKLVGKPIAINPNKELIKNIKEDDELREKTTIIVERKDVIYELDSSVNLFEIDD